ncbi:unnamed protein product [Linum tenue]|uniref:Uncharacterized protein n=1 Tax=Linum tenue TaxID=586396 RepID=A0AAV0MGY5_9ROSI|nr:unnamed protein product [Linum tenue]
MILASSKSSASTARSQMLE